MHHHREDGPYNPYPEETYGRRDGSPHREGHHHHHHHEHEHERSNSLEHRAPPPPPSPPGRGDSGHHGYGERSAPYEQHRPTGPYEEQRYDERRSSGSQYGAPAAPYPPGSNASGGHSYGDATYQTSPYASNPSIHREERHDPHRKHIAGLPVRLHCKADPNFSLAVVPGQGPVMKHTDPGDDFQIWYKDETMGTRVKDETGASSFSLINKATGEALRHAPEDLQQCLLAEYEPNGRDESVWWSMSEDMGHGYRCVRMATKISRNLDVLRGDKKSGGVKAGSPAITFAWKKQDNQIWKMTPACTSSSHSLPLLLQLFIPQNMGSHTFSSPFSIFGEWGRCRPIAMDGRSILQKWRSFFLLVCGWRMGWRRLCVQSFHQPAVLFLYHLLFTLAFTLPVFSNQVFVLPFSILCSPLLKKGEMRLP